MKFIIFFISLLFTISVLSEEPPKSSLKNSYTFMPLFLDANDGTGSVVGIEYGLESKWIFMQLKTPSGNGFGNKKSILSSLKDQNGVLELDIEGVWTNDDEINPESFSSATINIAYEISAPDDIETKSNDGFGFDFGLQYSVEGDQNYEDSQNLVAAATGFFVGDADGLYIDVEIAYGEVDASNDEQRKLMTNEYKFDRVDAELHFHLPLSLNTQKKYSPKSVAFNYRYFGEIDAPPEIESANQDKHQFGTVRIKFENGLFLGYAKGKLPFDFDTKSVLEIGFNQNIF